MKTMQNIRKHRDIKLVTTEGRRNLVFEPSYHRTNIFSDNLLVITMKKTQIFTNKPVYLVLSNIKNQWNSNLCVLVQFCETKIQKKAKLCDMDTDSFLHNIKTKDI